MSEVAYNASEEFNRSWDDVPDTYIPPAEGIYRGKITEATRGATKKEGKPQVTLTVKLEYDLVNDEEAKGSSKFNRVMITQGEGAFRLKQLVQAAGVEYPASPKPDDVDQFCDDLLGKEIHFRLKHTKSKNSDAIFLEVARYLTEEQAQEAASGWGSGDNGED